MNACRSFALLHYFDAYRSSASETLHSTVVIPRAWSGEPEMCLSVEGSEVLRLKRSRSKLGSTVASSAFAEECTHSPGDIAKSMPAADHCENTRELGPVRAGVHQQTQVPCVYSQCSYS